MLKASAMVKMLQRARDRRPGQDLAGILDAAADMIEMQAARVAELEAYIECFGFTVPEWEALKERKGAK